MSSLKKSQANAEASRARLNESRASPAGSAHDMGDLSNLEEELRLLRLDHDQLNEQVQKALPQIQGELETKASKADLEELEQRLMDRLNDMLNRLREMFAEKEPLRKKFLNVEKNVSLFYLPAQDKKALL